MQTIEQAVIGILAESLTADPSAINTETTMESLNADSLDMVEVVMEIEDTIEREIDDQTMQEMIGCKTVGDLVALVKKARGEQT